MPAPDEPVEIFIGADFDLGYEGAQAALSEAYLNSGTCTYQLKSSAGTVVGSGTLSYVAASDGNYRGTIESTVTATLTEDSLYYLEITFADSGYNDFRRFQLRAAYRKNN